MEPRNNYSKKSLKKNTFPNMFRAVIICCFASLLLACKSKQKLSTATVYNKHCIVANFSKSQVITYFDSLGIDYQWLKIKTKINTKYQEENISFTANFRIKKDSLIYASITKAGIPFAKVLATKDSIQIIDLFHKKFKTGTFEELDSLLGFSLPFSILEKFLLAKPSFLYQEEGLVQSDSMQAIFSNDYQLDSSNFYQSNSFRCDTLALQQTCVKSNGNDLVIQYSNQEDINGFPLNKNITLEAKQEDIVVILAEIEILRVKAYTQLKIPFSIPSDYEALD